MYIFTAEHEIAIMQPKNRQMGWVTVCSKSRASLEDMAGKFPEAFPIYELNRFEFAMDLPIRFVLMAVSAYINDLPGVGPDELPDWSKFDHFLGTM